MRKQLFHATAAGLTLAAVLSATSAQSAEPSDKGDACTAAMTEVVREGYTHHYRLSQYNEAESPETAAKVRDSRRALASALLDANKVFAEKKCFPDVAPPKLANKEEWAPGKGVACAQAFAFIAQNAAQYFYSNQWKPDVPRQTGRLTEKQLIGLAEDIKSAPATNTSYCQEIGANNPFNFPKTPRTPKGYLPQ